MKGYTHVEQLLQVPVLLQSPLTISLQIVSPLTEGRYGGPLTTMLGPARIIGCFVAVVTYC
jgi:hypothetical protein